MTRGKFGRINNENSQRKGYVGDDDSSGGVGGGTAAVAAVAAAAADDDDDDFYPYSVNQSHEKWQLWAIMSDWKFDEVKKC